MIRLVALICALSGDADAAALFLCLHFFIRFCFGSPYK